MHYLAVFDAYKRTWHHGC